VEAARGRRERQALGRVAMLSKKWTGATVVLMLAAGLMTAGCSRWLPWRDEPVATEVNLAFTLEQNLVTLESVTINDRPGRFLLGSAAPQTILDSAWAGRGRQILQIGEKESFTLAPAMMNLQGVADGIIGVEPWKNRSLSIDYRAGLVTFQKFPIEPALMTIFRYEAEPTISVNVNGADVAATVDTTNPDTLTLPSSSTSRGTAALSIAGTDFGTLDVGYAPVRKARVGNRLLSKFLVTIDYGQKTVGLWRDPRIPLTTPAEAPIMN
jgi:hypothetical protein